MKTHNVAVGTTYDLDIKIKYVTESDWEETLTHPVTITVKCTVDSSLFTATTPNMMNYVHTQIGQAS